METLRKSLKSYRSQAKEQGTMEEERQGLLYHSTDSQRAQSSESHDRKEEVIVKIDDDKASRKGTKSASASTGENISSLPRGSSKKYKMSFEEVLHEAVRKKSKDLPDRENHRLHDFSASFEKNSWKLLMSKAKSRLMDPPDEEYERATSFDGDESDGGHEEDDTEDIPEDYKSKQLSKLTMLQWLSLVVLSVSLVCILCVPEIKGRTLWDLPLWKWDIMVLALICGRLVSGWGIRIVVVFIEHNFLLRKRVLYFVYGLRRPVQNSLWLGLVLLVWHFLFNDKVEGEHNSKILPYGTKILVCFLAGTLIWLLKTLLVKVLASSFHVNTFFDRIQEALFNQYVIETLSGPPFFDWNETEEQTGSNTEPQEFKNSGSNVPGHEDLKATLLTKSGSRKLQKCSTIGRRPRFYGEMANRKHEEIAVDHLQKLNQKNISAWNMRRMIAIVRHGCLSTLDEQILDSDIKDETSLHIRSELQAKKAAKRIFHNVVKTGQSYIFLDDILLFMGKEEAMRAFGAACENEGISKAALKSWLVNAFRERRALALSLNDTKTSVDELHRMVNILVGMIILIICLIVLGIPITNFLVFISSQLLLLAFIFGNTCKTTFEAIVFLFITHPFDVGDRCEVDGVQMTVEEMHILTTVFLRYDNQKVIYPNSILATKPIGNFYRSPDMTETIDFSIHISTPMDKIAIMKERIKGFVEGNHHHWHPGSMVVVKDVEDMNRISMSLCLLHRMNHQQMGERLARRTRLVEELICLFRELDIQYKMLPLEVNVRNVQSLVSDRLPSNWSTCD